MPKSVSTGQEVQRTSGGSFYNVIPEGTYFAAIRGVKWEQFPTKGGITMEKFTPTIHLYNLNGTRIDRQDLTIGAVNDDGVYTAEFWGDGSGSAIFAGYDLTKGQFGARDFMFTLGMLNEDGDVVFNENAIVDVVVKVEIRTRSFEYKGVTRQENVVIRYSGVTPEDYPTILESAGDFVNPADFVSFTVCVNEPEDGRDPELQTLTFETEEAFQLWYERFYADDEWENPVGQLGATLPEVGLTYWEALIAEGQAQEETPEAVEEQDTEELPM